MSTDRTQATHYRLMWRITRVNADGDPLQEPYFGGATLSAGGPNALLKDVRALSIQMHNSIERLMHDGQFPELEP